MTPYPFTHKRIPTHTVTIGNVTVGGDSDIVIQTMCNTPAGDVEAGFRQAKEVAEAGAQIIRFAVRNVADAESLGEIRKKLNDAEITTPLVADVHFNPQAAFVAAQLIEKVRINPGNFIDKRATFQSKEYSTDEWNAELQRLESTFSELVDICRQHGTALRIGVNHGSLSDRIMSRYGNTVEGMVESAMEFLRLCRKFEFWNVVVSLKSSNVRIMITAYRMLVEKMQAENMNFPLHLGVTEAGNELGGRVRSAIGIGTLLADGIGDTIRVSLTESPAKEIPAAQKLAEYFKNRKAANSNSDFRMYDPYDYKYHQSKEVDGIGGQKSPVVVCDARARKVIDDDFLKILGYSRAGEEWVATSQAADVVYVGEVSIETTIPPGLKVLFEAAITKAPTDEAIPLFTKVEYRHIACRATHVLKWVSLTNDDLADPEIISILQKDPNIVLVLETMLVNGFADQRAAFLKLRENNIAAPVIVKRNYVSDDWESYILQSSADVGGLMVNGMGNGIWLTNPFLTEVDKSRELMFEILQASRVRISQTEFIACPSCGRTQFDIESVLAEVREKTKHLSHLKIGVMGCIVNGPGEMADADYGYVGAAPDKVMLYKGKVAVRKNIPTKNAVNELIELIKENGDWVDLK